MNTKVYDLEKRRNCRLLAEASRSAAQAGHGLRTLSLARREVGAKLVGASDKLRSLEGYFAGLSGSVADSASFLDACHEACHLDDLEEMERERDRLTAKRDNRALRRVHLFPEK